MSLWKNWNKIITLGIFLCSSLVFASSADSFVEEARRLASLGDYQNAAALYKKALKLDDKHVVASQELRNLMIESRRKNPHEEITEAELGLAKEAEL